jgi:protein-L-isoaspartate(D-aspartate) O-methyltransferase
VPQPLFDQLKEGGKMVIPIGDRFNQRVHLIIKQDGKRVDRVLKPTLFVPMTGRDQEEAAAARRAADQSKKNEP